MGGRLEGRVAIVTGASRGLGRNMAELFAAEGAAVVVAARSEVQWDERLPGTIHEAVEAIRARGGRALAIACDVSIEADLERLAEAAAEAFGPVDLLVNNAAITMPGGPGRAPSAPKNGEKAASRSKPKFSTAVGGAPGILEMSVGGFRRHFDAGLFAAYRLTQLVLPGMIELGRGAILNISSDAARRPPEGPYAGDVATTIAYGGNKIAMEHLTRNVAAQVAKYGVTVNSLSPSAAIQTPGLAWLTGGARPAVEVSEESFSEAALRLALATPEQRTGWNAYSEDVLHPELGRREWIG
ncbi:MAG: SDR family NAD(P)-dependent oxidoreductase [Caulobacteraceae bacterium]|nr:SDR family NAD(P)-dependent oxidoreductase [Caulobacteraceae bacterium]